MALTRSTAPLVWIDCEMTGLNPGSDLILSLSCYITTHDLQLLDDEGYHVVVQTGRQVLDNMSEWCVETHGRTGLTQQCLESDTTAEQAASELMEYIRQYVPEQRTGLLAGNSVHLDKMFLMQRPWQHVVDWLHYRILDVSAIKEAVRRWCPDEVIEEVPEKKGLHEAAEDIRESIEEARYYMGLFERMTTTSTTGTHSQWMPDPMRH